MEFELKQIKELMAAMGRSGATRLQLKLGENELILERAAEESEAKAVPVAMPHHFPAPHTFPAPPPPAFAPASEAAGASEAEAEGLFITAPMVGTMYHAASPDEPPFIKVGDRVEEGSVVAIIEAMKVMNEVKAGVSGTVEEILITNGQPVEFGTKLIRIKAG